MELECYLLKELYYNEESMYSIVVLSTESELPFYTPCIFDALTKKNLHKFTAKGRSIRLTPGVKYILKGEHVVDEKYGNQINITSIDSVKEFDEVNTIKFLSSILTPNQVVNVMDACPDIVNTLIKNPLITLPKIKGVGEASEEKIRNKILENYKMSSFLISLQEYGISLPMVKKIAEQSESMDQLEHELKKNPYILCEKINGIGFKKADQYALNVRPELLYSKERCHAAIKYLLDKIAEEDGDTYVSGKDFSTVLLDLVPECADKYKEILQEETEKQNINKNTYHIDNDRITIGSQDNYNIEHKIWNILKTQQRNSVTWYNDNEIDAKIKQSELNGNFEFTPEQRDFIKGVNSNNINVLIGKAGCGKSFSLKGVYEVYGDKHIASCALAAKAARRIVEATGKEGASTIHMLLGYSGQKFTFNKDNKLPIDLLILDEAGMVNIELIYNLFSAIGPRTKVIIVGDTGQLPPIGAGSFLRDVVDKSNVFRTTILTKIHRQAAKSAIITDANIIREGLSPISEFTSREIHGELQDMFYLFAPDKQAVFNAVINTYRYLLKKGIKPDDIAVLAPMKEGLNSTTSYNNIIQDMLLKYEPHYIQISENKKIKPGDKIIQCENNYDKNVMNGEIGTVKEILFSEKKHDAIGIIANFPDLTNNGKSKEVMYNATEIRQLDLAYSLTIHKMQGSGVPYVIIALETAHFVMLDRTILYTGITRAKKECYLISMPQAFTTCLTNNNVDGRKTYLSLINPYEEETNE